VIPTPENHGDGFSSLSLVGRLRSPPVRLGLLSSKVRIFPPLSFLKRKRHFSCRVRSFSLSRPVRLGVFGHGRNDFFLLRFADFRDNLCFFLPLGRGSLSMFFFVPPISQLIEKSPFFRIILSSPVLLDFERRSSL